MSETEDVNIDYGDTSEPQAVPNKPMWEESFIATRMLLPDHAWITRELTPKGKGARAMCGRIFGLATEWAPRSVQFDGKQLDSIRLGGDFEFLSFITGETGNAPALYLPRAYSEKVMRALDAGSKPFAVDVVVGLEATGKQIAYRWGILSFRDDPMRKEVISMRDDMHPAVRAMIGKDARQLISAPAR